MDTVNKDLREKIDKVEKIDKEKKKNDDIELLKRERDFFREEAIRLNEICKELSKVKDDLLRENKFKIRELKDVMKKWNDSEYANKQLLAELEKNVRVVKNYENEKKHLGNSYTTNNHINNSKIMNNNINNSITGNFKSIYNTLENSSYMIKNTSLNTGYFDNKMNKYNIDNSKSFMRDIYSIEKTNDLNKIRYIKNTNNKTILNNSSSFNQQNYSTENLEDNSLNNNYNNVTLETQIDKDKIVKIIEKLKADLKKEKNRNQKMIGEFNNVLLDKKNMEKIFMDCVEESRKEIQQRKLRDTINTKSGFFANLTKRSIQTLPTINEIKFENFQPSDKRRLVETFLMKDEIVNFVKNNLSSIIPDNKASYFQKNYLNDSFFNLRQTLTKNDSKLFTINDFSKSKNSLRSSSKHKNEMIK